MHMMMSSGGHNMDVQGALMLKPERPNSLGPKITKRINFYHGDNCKYPERCIDRFVRNKCGY